jgi:MFS family permease
MVFARRLSGRALRPKRIRMGESGPPPTPRAAAADIPPPLEQELHEPGTSGAFLQGRPFTRYLTWYTVAFTSITIVWGSVIGILLPNQVQLLEFPLWFTGADGGADLQSLTLLRQQVADGAATPTAEQQRLLGILGNFEAAKASSLAVITALGVAVTMVAQPIIGVLSDRTRSQAGRRAPWILFGGLTGAAALAAMPFAPTIAVLGVIFTAAQVLLNVAQSPLTATIADRVPARLRGTASAMSGIASFFGGLLGGLLAGVLFGAIGLWFYFPVAAFVAVGVALFVLLARDRSSRDLVVPPHRWREFFVGFTVALRARNFRWVWIARILLTFGYTVSTALGLYLLQSYVQPALSAAEATALVPLIGLVGIPVTVITVLIAGRLSDRVGRRKPFVIAASALMAVSMILPVLSPTLPGVLAQALIAGIAFGIYLPVDQALFIDVLPDRNSAGRDLGVASLGNNLGQALGPILAGAVVMITGGYLGIWVSAFVLTALAAVAILPVRGVR